MKRVVQSAWICGVALLLAGAAPAQAQEPLGVALCVPASIYGDVKALNEGAPRHIVTLLHTTQAIFGSYRAQAATVSIRPRTPAPGQPLEFRLPTSWFATIVEMNPNTEMARVASNDAFVTVQALQSDQSIDLSRTRYLMIPLDALFALQQLNPGRTLTLIHSAQLLSANVPLLAALIAMDQSHASGLAVPQVVLVPLQLLNTNLRIINPRAVVGGIPVATIEVRPRPN